MNSLNKSLEYILSNARLRTNLVRKTRAQSMGSPLSSVLKRKTQRHTQKAQSLQPLLKNIDQELLNTILTKQFSDYSSNDIVLKDAKLFRFTLAHDDYYDKTHRFLIDIYTVANRMTIDLLSRLKTELPSAKLLHIRDTNRRVNRSLLLYQYAPHIFNDILTVDAYEPRKDRRSALRCSSYTTSKKTSHSPLDGFYDQTRLNQFNCAISSVVFCPEEHIETKVSESIGSSANTDVYELTVIYLESVSNTCIDNRLDFYSESNQRKALYITYYKASNVIEIFSSSSRIRLDALHCFLQAFGNSKDNDLSQIVYNIRQLAHVTPLPMNGPDAVWAKVTKLTYVDNGRRTSYSIDADDPVDIYDTIKNTSDSHTTLDKVVEASITLKMNSPCNNRYTRIDLFGTHTCQIITSCGRDRWLCHGLLEHWGLIRRIAHAPE